MNMMNEIRVELNTRTKGRKTSSPKSKKMKSAEKDTERVLTPWGVINVPNDDTIYLGMNNKTNKKKGAYIDENNSDFHKVKEEINLPIRFKL